MKKKIYTRLAAGLLCGVLLFTNAASMGAMAFSQDIDVEKAGNTAVLTESGDERIDSDTSVMNEGGGAEQEKISPETESDEETAEPETTEEMDKEEENSETETAKEEQEEQSEGAENSDQENKETEEKEAAVGVEEEGTLPEEEVGQETVSENTVEESIPEETELVANVEMAAADGDIASGTSKKITWNIDASGTLTVSGTGDWGRSDSIISKAPWYDYREEITAAIVNVQGMTNASKMFYGCSNLLTADVKAFDTSKVTYMSDLFSGCRSLKNVDLRHFDTSNVETMDSMFYDCQSLTELDLSSFNTKNVKWMSSMFYRCSNLKKLDLSGFQTDKLYLMSSMFASCHNLMELNVSHFDTSHVGSISFAFQYCESLKVLDISNFDLSKIDQTTSDVFLGCKELTTIYAPYNVSSAIKLPYTTSKDVTWYRSDGTALTELPQNLVHSVALGKNYIPTEKTPDNPPDENDLEEEYISKEEKFVRDVTQYPLENALKNTDEETEKEIRRIRDKLYDLMFKAHFAPEGQDPDKTVTFSGDEDINHEWPYQNGKSGGTIILDSNLGNPVDIEKSCVGCLSYARFVSKYVHGGIGSRKPDKDMSEKNVKNLIHEHIDPGETIGFSNNKEGEEKKSHFVAFLGETEDGKGFYCMSYGGGGDTREAGAHKIEVKKLSYKEFVDYYVINNRCDEFVYYDANGGSYFKQSTKKTTSPSNIVMQVNCPVEAMVELNGEKLDSCSPSSASFGTVDRNGEQIMFDLNYALDYKLTINGTGEGTMALLLSYYDELGILINQRKFVNIPITVSTQIESSGFNPISDFILYVSDENEGMRAWGAGPDETVSEPNDSFLPETFFEFDTDDETGVHYKDIPENGEIPNGLWISEIPDAVYSAAAIKPEVRVYDGEKRLKQGRDYTISYKNNTNAAQAIDAKPPTVVVKGKGNYSGTETQTFNIIKRDISDAYVTKTFTDAYALSINGKNPTLVFSAKCNKKALKKNTDYILVVKNGNGTEVTDYTEEGTYTLVVKGNGVNYIGETTLTFDVLNKIPVSKLKISKLAALEYDGKSKKPEPVVKYGKVTLNKGTDYSLRYQNNREMGTATVTITGKGDYFGTRNVSFTITGRQIQKAKFTGFKNSFPYTGDTIYQREAVLRYGEEELVKGTDYTVSYSNHLNKGKSTATYTGIGNYTGTIKKTYNITAYNIATDAQNRISLSADEISAVYAKGGARPSVKVYDGTLLLTEGKDYTLSYQNNTTVTTPATIKQPSITVKGKGNYTGVFAEKKTFIITPKDIAEVTVTASDVAASPKIGGYRSTPVLTDTNDKRLKAGTDYDKTCIYTYKNTTEKVINDEVEVIRSAGDLVEENDIIPANTVLCVSIRAKEGGNYTGEKTAEYRIVTAPISKAKITVQNPAQNNKNLFTYTGQEIRIDKSNLIVKVGTDVLSDDQYEILEDTYKIISIKEPPACR